MYGIKPAISYTQYSNTFSTMQVRKAHKTIIIYRECFLYSRRYGLMVTMHKQIKQYASKRHLSYVVVGYNDVPT